MAGNAHEWRHRKMKKPCTCVHCGGSKVVEKKPAKKK